MSRYLKILREHGLEIIDETDEHVRMVCVYCAKPKLYFNVASGGWDCKVCGRKGGVPDFFAGLAKRNQPRLTGRPAGRLARSRGVRAETLRAWGVGWDGDQYTIPADGAGRCTTLLRYSIGGKALGTTGSTAGLLGRKGAEGAPVWVLEGLWDAMALGEALADLGRPDGVYATTGASSFPKAATRLFAGRDVRIAFDNDAAGVAGVERVRRLLGGTASRVSHVSWEAARGDGYDVRDAYKDEGSRVVETLEERLTTEAPALGEGGGERIEGRFLGDGEGVPAEEVIAAYREFLYLPETEVLSILYGAAFANRLVGDPLWLFLVAPPGGSKTELLMSMCSSPLFLPATTLTPQALISGAQGPGGSDPSLIPQLDRRILVVKDFTAVLNMPSMARDEIFGILRDAYDGSCEKFFGNGIHRRFESLFGVMAGVTPAIELFSLQSSMLGERFLRYRMRPTERIRSGEPIIRAALANIAKEKGMRTKLQQTAKRALEKRIDEDNLPKMSETVLTLVTQLAQWIAALRGVVPRDRFTQRVEFRPTREVGTRLAKQLAKLALGMAIFHDAEEVGERELTALYAVARSTVPDRVEDVVRALYVHAGRDAATVDEIRDWVGLPVDTLKSIMADLELLRIVRTTHVDGPRGRPVVGYCLSMTMFRLVKDLGLYDEQMIGDQARRGTTRVLKRRRKRI